MKSDKRDLYCSQCDKNYTLDESQIQWMMSHCDNLILVEKGSYRFDNGCFFKERAKLQRQDKHHNTLHINTDRF